MKKNSLLGGGLALLGVLGAGALPGVVAAAGETASLQTEVRAVINSTISITSSAQSATPANTVTINYTPLSANDTSGGVAGTGTETITVNTNNSAGYTLTLMDDDSTTYLMSGGGDQINAAPGTIAAPQALSAATAAQWGFRTNVIAPDGPVMPAGYAGITGTTGTPGVTNIIKNTNSVATADQTVVTWGVIALSSQPSGTYTDTVVYTAIAN